MRDQEKTDGDGNVLSHVIAILLEIALAVGVEDVGETLGLGVVLELKFKISRHLCRVRPIFVAVAKMPVKDLLLSLPFVVTMEERLEAAWTEGSALSPLL